MRQSHTSTIAAPLAKVWQALTDVTVIEHWTTGPVQMEPHVGGEFNLYEGDIHGTTTEISAPHHIRQDWYGPNDPDHKYDMTFMLVADGPASTALTITYDTPHGKTDTFMSVWERYYVSPLTQLLAKQATDRIKLKLISKQNLTGNVWSFRFEPTKPLYWTAGQYVWVELMHESPDVEGTRRWFTISSAPYEEVIQITTRITGSTFKQALSVLPLSGELELLEKPDGDFIWHDQAAPLVFVAGGIGITAFHSMCKQRIHDGLPLRVVLLYANRDEHIAFKDEFDDWAREHPEFDLRYLTGAQLSAESLVAEQPTLLQSLVYLSGPEQMVKAVGDQLLAAGLPQAQLRLDALPNYTRENY
jgi:ferredoxin-NADP reductase/uncharacterized protein YndB with AHSA1/START domain